MRLLASIWKWDLAPFFLHKSNHVAAAAAQTVGRLEAVALAEPLADAFAEWMKNPGRARSGMQGLDHDREDAGCDGSSRSCGFSHRQGIRHVQMEASFGPRVDTAAALRGLCAQGLARMSHPDAFGGMRDAAGRSGACRARGTIRGIPRPGNTRECCCSIQGADGDADEEVMADFFARVLRLAAAEIA